MIKKLLLTLAIITPLAAAPVVFKHTYGTSSVVSKVVTKQEKTKAVKVLKPKKVKTTKWNCTRIKNLTPAEIQYGLKHVTSEQVAQIRQQCGL